MRTTSEMPMFRAARPVTHTPHRCPLSRTSNCALCLTSIGILHTAHPSPDEATIAHVLSAGDPRAVLCLPANASAEAVRAAFKRCVSDVSCSTRPWAMHHLVVLSHRLALQLHPDKCQAPRAAEAFAAIAAAAEALLQPSPAACGDRDASWWHAFATPCGSQQHKADDRRPSSSSEPRGACSLPRAPSNWQRNTTWHAPALHGAHPPTRHVVSLLSDDSPERLPRPQRRTTQGNLDAWLRPSCPAGVPSDDSSDEDSSDGSSGLQEAGEQQAAPGSPRQAGQQVLQQQQRVAVLRAAQALQRRERLRTTLRKLHKARRRK